MSFNIVMKVVVIALVLGLFGNIFYKASKTIKNKNDERWQLIQVKANKATVWFHTLLIGAIGLMMFIDVKYTLPNSYSLSNILLVAYLVLTLQYTIELIYLIYLDKKI